MRKILTLALIALLSGTVGCRMCASCFDHFGPVLDEPGLTNDGVHNRAGTAFTGEGPALAPSVEEVPLPPVEPEEAPAAPTI